MTLNLITQGITIKYTMTDKIEMNGYWYEYERKAAKDRVDICLATKDPKQYCNGVYLYSMKDPGSGIEFVVTDTNDPLIKARLLSPELRPLCTYCKGTGIDPYPHWDTTVKPCPECNN